MHLTVLTLKCYTTCKYVLLIYVYRLSPSKNLIANINDIGVRIIGFLLLLRKDLAENSYRPYCCRVRVRVGFKSFNLFCNTERDNHLKIGT